MNKSVKRINIHKRNNKKTVQTIENTVNTSTHITKILTHYETHTYTHQHITKPTHTQPTHYKTHTYTHPHTPTHYKTHTYTHPHINLMSQALSANNTVQTEMNKYLV